jgi:acyl carrier protein
LDLQRLTRLGMVAMNATHALALFDAAIASGEASLMPAKLDLARMQKQLAGSEPPALLRVLLRSGLRRAKAGEQDASALRVRLAAVAEPKRLAWLIELVRSEVAQVLGLAGPSAVSPSRELKTFGFDSLMAVELRNRLSALVGSSLPPTLAFDYPTPAALGELLLARILPAAAAAKKPKVTRQEIRSLAELLGTASSEQLEAHGLLSGLLKLRDALKPNGSHATPKAEVDLSDRDELFRFLEERVGAE